VEEVRNLIVEIPGRRAFQAEGETRANTQKQKHFLEYLRRHRRTIVWSRVSEEVVAGEDIRKDSEAFGPMEILGGIIGYYEEKMGSHCKVLSTEVLSLVYMDSGYIFKVKSTVFLNGLELSSERCKIT